MTLRLPSYLTLAAVFAAGCVAGGVMDVNDDAAAEVSPPAYMIVIGNVTDREALATGYAALLPPLYEKYGGTYLSIGSEHEVLEGETGFESHVLAEWPSREAALKFWNSPEYDALRRARIDGGWGEFDVFLIEGLVAPTITSPLAESVEDGAAGGRE